MNGMLDIKKSQSLLWRFHHAKFALRVLQEHQQKVLMKLHEFVERRLTYNYRLQATEYSFGNTAEEITVWRTEHWSDRSKVNNSSRQKDYRDFYKSILYLEDLYFIQFSDESCSSSCNDDSSLENNLDI
jgi:hypothetical protein